MVKIHIFVLFIQIQIVAKTAGMHRNEWVENADRWVAGFLEMFEEGCHKMVSFVIAGFMGKSFVILLMDANHLLTSHIVFLFCHHLDL